MFDQSSERRNAETRSTSSTPAWHMGDLPFVDPPQLRSSDSLPVRTTSPELLDLDKVVAHIESARKKGRYQGSDDPIEYLIQQQCLVAADDHLYATIAGIMCFGRDPQSIFRHAVVDIGHYQGIKPIASEVVHLEKNVGGTIFDQIARVEEYLWRNTHHGMTLTEQSSQRVELHEYPRAVIRELGVNMLAHRDYTISGSAARVQLFSNRIEWISPGGLPPGVTVDNLLDSQAARNAVILSVLFEAGYVEAFGQGLDTVVDVLKQEQLPEPGFRDVGAAFIVTVFGRPMLSHVPMGPLVELTPTQRRIAALLRNQGWLAPRDLRTQLPDLPYRTLARELRTLVDAGIVEATGRSVAIQYRLRDLVSGQID